MGIYRQIELSFFDDRKVQDEMTPESRYVFLYLLASSQSQLGCNEISWKQMSLQLGYNIQSTQSAIFRLRDEHKVIDFDEDTNELLICNFAKYQWTTSESYVKGLLKDLGGIKTERFKRYLTILIHSQASKSYWNRDIFNYYSGTWSRLTDEELEHVLTDKQANSRPHTLSNKEEMQVFIENMNHSNEAKENLKKWLFEVCLPQTKMSYETFVEKVNELEKDCISEQEFCESIRNSVLNGYRVFVSPKRNYRKSTNNAISRTNYMATAEDLIGAKAY